LFKGITNIASMIRQASQMQGKMKDVNEKLKFERVTGSAGAGMVEVEANGHGEILRVKIEPELVERGDREMIEDLLPAAVNQATAKAKQLQVEAMTDGMDMSGLNEALEQMVGGGPSEAD